MSPKATSHSKTQVLQLLRQKHASLAAKLEAEQAETARVRKAHDRLQRKYDELKIRMPEENTA